MTEYQKCFLAIPLADQYLSQYQRLLDQLKDMVPNGRYDNYDTPHITIAPLGRHTEKSLFDYVETIEKFNLLADLTLSVSGLKVFTPDEPRYITLDVKTPYRLAKFAEDARRKSPHPKILPYDPHLTLFKAHSPESQAQYQSNQQSVASSVKNICWNYKLTTLAIWGKPTPKTPKEKILHIKL